jgi:hypothetical protein
MTFGKIQRKPILKAHSSMREHFLLRLRQDLCEGAKKHLHRGLMMRLAMLEEALLILDEEVSKAQEPLDQYLSVRLTLFLNAYYLNLAGSLDNLAWALTYQHDLIDNIDEDNVKHRRFVQLLGDKFLARLRQKHFNQLSDELEPFRDWYQDVRQFRDPAAHRIPLNVPISVYSEDDAKRYQSLDEEAAELIKAGKHDKGMALVRKSHRLGKYMPIFISEAPKLQFYDLAGRVDLDHGNWLQVVEVVFREGFQRRNIIEGVDS